MRNIGQSMNRLLKKLRGYIHPSKRIRTCIRAFSFFGQAGELIVVMNNSEGYLLMFSAEDEQRFDALHETLLRLADDVYKE